MYPFREGQSFVRDRWYIAGFSDEITREPIERTLLGIPVALYRTETGAVVAMYGLCPHRYYPLALGHLDGDNIVCGYHGFTFGPQGNCVRIPAQNTGANFVQPTYAAIERGPLVWVWLGEQSAADPALIPPYEDFGLSQPGWAWGSKSYFHLEGRAQLLIDNLMDLTHLPFVHNHLPGGAAHLNSKLETEQRDCSYRVRKYAKVQWTRTSEFLYGAEHRFEGSAERMSLTDFYGPELVRTSGPIVISLDSGEPVPAGVGELYYMHGITPETERTTHYFGFTTRNFRLEHPTLGDELRAHDVKIRQQDVETIAAVERRLNDAAARQAALLAVSDRAAVKVRGMIQTLLDRESERAGA